MPFKHFTIKQIWSPGGNVSRIYSRSFTSEPSAFCRTFDAFEWNPMADGNQAKSRPPVPQLVLINGRMI